MGCGRSHIPFLCLLFLRIHILFVIFLVFFLEKRIGLLQVFALLVKSQALPLNFDNTQGDFVAVVGHSFHNRCNIGQYKAHFNGATVILQSFDVVFLEFIFQFVNNLLQWSDFGG